MEKKFFLLGVAVLLSASLFFLGCPTDDGTDDTAKSDNASVTEASVTVKGQTVAFTATKTGADFASAVEGSVILVDSALTGTTNFALPEKAAAKAVHSATALANEAAFDAITAEFANDTTLPGGVSYIYLKVTAEDEKAVKWYKITVTVTLANKGGYSLVESEADTSAPKYNVSVDYAWKNVADKKVFIKLTGTFNADYLRFVTASQTEGETTYKNGVKFNREDYSKLLTTKKSPVGKYGEISVKGLLEAGTSHFAIKNINPAFALYTEQAAVDGHALSTDGAGPVTGSYPYVHIYIPANGSTPSRWKYYAGPATATSVLGLLVFENAAKINKSFELVIDQYENKDSETDGTVLSSALTTASPAGNFVSHIATVTIDFSDVVFEDATDATTTPVAGNDAS
jgi:hypothetical protein